MDASGIMAFAFVLMLWSALAAGGNATIRQHMLNLAIGLFLGVGGGTEVYKWQEYETPFATLWGLGAFLAIAWAFVAVAAKRNWNAPNFMHRIHEKGELARLDKVEDDAFKARMQRGGGT